MRKTNFIEAKSCMDAISKVMAKHLEDDSTTKIISVNHQGTVFVD